MVNDISITSHDSLKISKLKTIPRLDKIGVIFSFAIIVFLIIGESLNGIYNVITFLPLFIIPFLYILRFRDILPEKSIAVANQHPSFFSFDRFFALITIIVTFISIPYNLALLGILVQDTWLNVIFTGHWAHGGLHHGWVGWFFIFEAYFYHRINRLTENYHDISITFRNGLAILGVFLFLDDFWYEEISQGILGWPDIFRTLNGLLPYSWNWNFFLQIGLLAAFTIMSHAIGFWLQRKKGGHL